MSSVGLYINSFFAAGSYRAERGEVSRSVYSLVSSIAAGALTIGIGYGSLFGLVENIPNFAGMAIRKVFPRINPNLLAIIKLVMVIALLVLAFHFSAVTLDVYLKFLAIQTLSVTALKILHPLSLAGL